MLHKGWEEALERQALKDGGYTTSWRAEDGKHESRGVGGEKTDRGRDSVPT